MFVFVFLFIILSPVNFPKSRSHFYKLPRKILAKTSLPQKNPKMVNLKPQKILRTSPSLKIR